jgi:hypothetical protein
VERSSLPQTIGCLEGFALWAPWALVGDLAQEDKETRSRRLTVWDRGFYILGLPVDPKGEEPPILSRGEPLPLSQGVQSSVPGRKAFSQQAL